MVKRGIRTPLTVLIAIVAVGGLFSFAFLLGGENLVQGNVVPLALTENFRDLNCDAWNELAVTKGGVVSVVGSGRSGFNPSFDSSFQTLTITDGVSEVDTMHVRLLIACSGNFVKRSTATVISGSMNFQLCGNPRQGNTVCFAGDDRTFSNLGGSAVSVQTFFNVPIIQQPIADDQRVILFEGDISAFELERLFSAGDGTIHFKSVIFPVLTWTFNHPTLGVFTSTYSAINANQPIIAQYGALRVADIDTDGDGIFDLSDGCISQPETVNGFQDADGCPDTVPVADTDGDGILDDVDQCVSMAETFNNFQDADGCPDEVPPPTQEIIILTDVDGDGVTDDIDLCLVEVGTIANLGCPEEVIAETPIDLGSPLADDDGDGVLNAVDSCPNEFGTLTNLGCPEEIIAEPAIEPVIEDIGERLPTVIPPPLFEEPVIQPPAPIQPTTRIVGEPTPIEDRTIVILGLLFVGIIIIIVVAIFTRMRRK